MFKNILEKVLYYREKLGPRNSRGAFRGRHIFVTSATTKHLKINITKQFIFKMCSFSFVEHVLVPP